MKAFLVMLCKNYLDSNRFWRGLIKGFTYVVCVHLCLPVFWVVFSTGQIDRAKFEKRSAEVAFVPMHAQVFEVDQDFDLQVNMTQGNIRIQNYVSGEEVLSLSRDLESNLLDVGLQKKSESWSFQLPKGKYIVFSVSGTVGVAVRPRVSESEVMVTSKTSNEQMQQYGLFRLGFSYLFSLCVGWVVYLIVKSSVVDILKKIGVLSYYGNRRSM